MPRNENLRQERLAITRAAVIGVSHPETGEAVRAVVVYAKDRPRRNGHRLCNIMRPAEPSRVSSGRVRNLVPRTAFRQAAKSHVEINS